MGKMFPLMVAAALTATTPAIAQDTNAANADTAVANDVLATDNLSVEPVTADPANDLANVPMPVDEPIETAPAAEPAKSGFPWGVLGLLGLIGLMPRKRRD